MQVGNNAIFSRAVAPERFAGAIQNGGTHPVSGTSSQGVITRRMSERLTSVENRSPQKRTLLSDGAVDTVKRTKMQMASASKANLLNQLEAVDGIKTIPYKEGKFTGLLFPDGKPAKGYVKDMKLAPKRSFSGRIDNGTLVARGGTRYQREGTTTPFQRTLEKNEVCFEPHGTLTLSREHEALRKEVLNYDKKFLRISDDKDKFDINNDTARRVFDTVFAKKTLESIAGDDNKRDRLKHLSDNIFKMFKSTFKPQVIKDWQAACEGNYNGKDGRLIQLVTQLTRLRESVDALDIPEGSHADGTGVTGRQSPKAFLVDLYKQRYLNYLVDETQKYGEQHPHGLSKASTNPLYQKGAQLRGPHYARLQSASMGIGRSNDQMPFNLQFRREIPMQEGISADVYTRCPDRFNIGLPSDIVNSDGDSWATNVFMQGNTAVVNGLSGSMLIEIGNMAFFKARLLEGDAADDFLQRADIVPLLNDYFQVTAAMYTFIDGGHSLFEIQESFKQSWIPNLFADAFGEGGHTIGQELFSDKRIFVETFNETKAFHHAMQARKETNALIKEKEVTASGHIAPDRATFPKPPKPAEASTWSDWLPKWNGIGF